MIKTIVFDFDGVLVESMEIKTHAFAALFASEGSEAVEQIVTYHLQNGGVSRFEKFRYIFRSILDRPLSEKSFDALCRAFEKLVTKQVILAPYVPGACEFLEAHAASHRLFVASATPQKELEQILERRGILCRFERVYGAPTGKGAAVRDILAQTGANPWEAAFIGDALSDYAAAQETGVHFLARIHDNASLFRYLNCRKMPDLSGLYDHIASLGNSTASG